MKKMTEPAPADSPKVDPKLLEILVCPVTRQPLNTMPGRRS